MNWYIPSMDVGYIPRDPVHGVVGAAYVTGPRNPAGIGIDSDKIRNQKMCVSTTIFLILGGAMIGFGGYMKWGEHDIKVNIYSFSKSHDFF